MIETTAAAISDAARRAEFIYAQARSEVSVRLWRAALGSAPEQPAATAQAAAPLFNLSTLLELATGELPAKPPSRTAAAGTVAGVVAGAAASVAVMPRNPPARAVQGALPLAATNMNLGANAGYSSSITRAAARTGIPPAALASIIDAEAAKGRDGRWQTESRNRRSSATGLGQFLSGTWKSEAERLGTWLNTTARQNGWIGANGQVLPQAQAELLALRHDADASINATADYAKHSLRSLEAAGVAIGKTVDQIAKAAYLGHNLGVGDAVRFLRDGLDDSRARRLLDAQVGHASAARRVADAGSAAAAHRDWLTEFMDRRIVTRSLAV
jgi:hypothetical protein